MTYTTFECACHGRFSIPAPATDGEWHSISFPRMPPPDADPAEEVADEVHLLVARSGKWEIRE